MNDSHTSLSKDYTKMKCLANGCGCISFKINSSTMNQCNNCSHQWPFHALHRICRFLMLSSDRNENSLVNLTEEIMSMILFGCHAIPVQLKILLDRHLSFHQQVQVVRMLTNFGWSFQDYSRGYMLLNENGTTRTLWNKCSFESEILIIRQFLMFPETRSIASQMLSNIKDVDLNNSQIPNVVPDMLTALAMCAYMPSDRFFQSQIYKSQLSNNGALSLNPASQLMNSSMSLLNRISNYPTKDEKLSDCNGFSKSYEVDSIKKTNQSQPCTVTDYKQNLSKANATSQDSCSDSTAICSTPKSQSFISKAVVNSSSLTITNISRSKRRVLCTTCKKTFCDKGALKIHYSAVHLREMHRCTIKGCNMWFSSRRSRNRHSSNPNPRLHLSHSNKKLPDNSVIVDDGTGRQIGKRLPIPNSILNPPVITTKSENDIEGFFYCDDLSTGESEKDNFKHESDTKKLEESLSNTQINQDVFEKHEIKDAPKLFTINSVIN